MILDARSNDGEGDDKDGEDGKDEDDIDYDKDDDNEDLGNCRSSRYIGHLVSTESAPN